MAREFITGTIGVVLLGMAIFAEQIGIDNDPGWGKGRMIILGLGIILISINILAIVLQNRLLKLKKNISDLIYRIGTINYFAKIHIFSLLAATLVIACYVWFLLPGFKSPGNAYYSQLAMSFKRHQLYLPEEPSPQLLSINDPYNYELRKQSNVDYPWDISLYKGKFYMYWGPVPSLILIIFSDGMLANMGDQYLVFAFVCGLFLYSALFTICFWLRFNQNLPGWLIGFSLLVIGLSAPTTQMLNNPRIYEAAVFGCQFFFIGGCYWTFAAINGDKAPSLWKLAVAGLHWALALGTRIIILPAITFVILVTLIYLWGEIKSATPKRFLLFLFAMGTPLLISIIGLGWYNWMRFGSVFELGVRYQLALVDYGKFTNLFSAGYIYENFLNYFIRPYQIQAGFPFIAAIENVASNNKLAGLLYTSPYLLIALIIPVARFLYPRLSGKKRIPGTNAPERWLAIVLAGSALILSAIILSYFFASMNYTADFMPSIFLLATYCLGRGYDLLSGSRNPSRAYVFLTVLLMVFSVGASTLIALPGRR